MKDSSFLALLLATLGIAWLCLYEFDMRVSSGDGILLMVVHLLVPAAAVALTAWLICRMTASRVAWFDRVATHWPPLIGAHVLLMAAVLFGTRIPGIAYYNVPLQGWGSPTGFPFSEWAIDLWIGPFATTVASVTLALVLLMAFSRRWAAWRAVVVLAAGCLIVLAVLLFQAALPPSQFTLTRDEFTTSSINHASGKEMANLESHVFGPYSAWIQLTRQSASGWGLTLVAGCLVIAGGAAMLKQAEVPRLEPHLSRVALCGATIPLLFLAATSTILLIAVSQSGTWHSETAAVVEALSCPPSAIAVIVLGIIAVRQIKRSNGRIYGLRLAAVEVLLLPLVFLFLVVGEAIFWLTFGLFMLVSPHVRDHDVNWALIVPIILASIAIALTVTLFTGRWAWRAIVRPGKGKLT